MGKRAESLRTDVLALLSAQRAPLSAYDVLDALSTDGRRLAPTTIYRALAALVESGSVHRLESRNAFVACQRRCAGRASVLAICEACGAVEETVSKDVMAALATVAGETGFTASRHVVEVIGQCAACSATEGRS